MAKKTKVAIDAIFTPQGMLGKVSKNPNLDFLMNIFKIPRIYGVSGFGDWNVGQHTMATAFLALYWSSFYKYPAAKRDQLVTLALMHDAHEAVIGDILPFFKTPDVREAIDAVQKDILNSFGIVDDKKLAAELKLIDMISFLYEIGQSSPAGFSASRRNLLEKMYNRQREAILAYAKENKVDPKKVEQFLKRMEL